MDLSSQSRFVRAAFVKMNPVSTDEEDESVSQFFYILNSVAQQRGCWQSDDGKYELQFILHVAMWQKEFTIIQHITIIKLQRLISMKKTWMEIHLLDFNKWRAYKFSKLI